MMEFILKVESYLKEMNYQMAALEVLNPDNAQFIDDEGMELITKLCDVGLQSSFELDDISTCSELLNYICSSYNPKLALVSTLEQAEAFMHSSKFTIILKAIQIVFSRHPTKRASTYAWTLDLFNKHLQEFQTFPDGLKNKLTEGLECSLVENDSKVRSIFSFYNELFDFYVPVVKDFKAKCHSESQTSSYEGKTELGKQERILTSSLVNLLGPPLIYFDLTLSSESKSPSTPRKRRSRPGVKKPDTNTNLKSKSKARLIAERIVNQIVQVNLDSSFLLKWTERKCLPQPELDEIDYDEDVEEVEFQKTAIANYFYLVYVEDLSSEQRQSTYTATHLFKVILPLIFALLVEEEQNYLTIQKGLLLAQKLIHHIPQPLTSEFITGQIYSAFVKKLTELIVYFDIRSIRELALALLKTYFWKFDPAGRYFFFQFILANVRHPGLLGYMIGQLKDCIAVTLEKEEENLEEMERYFFGNNLSQVMLKICKLADGATADLCEAHDKIIAVLNLIRFLLLRDGITNKTGILEDMPKIEVLMLKPLREALVLTKVHYIQRLNELEDPDYKGGDHEEMTSLIKSVSIGGHEEELENVSTEDRIKCVHQALCNIDILESLVARVNECYEIVTTQI